MIDHLHTGGELSLTIPKLSDFNVKTRVPQNVKRRPAQNVYLGLHQNGLSVEADDREAGGHGEEVDCHAALFFIELTFSQ
jgi:hypothetical protein